MNRGDRFKVVRQINDNSVYPWIPDLVGRTGVVTETHLDILDYYLVTMDQPFKIHRPPDGVSAINHVPDMALAEETRQWAFVTEEITEIVDEKKEGQ